MSTEDAIELVTKMTIGPNDVIVVNVSGDAHVGEVAQAIARDRGHVPKLVDVPFIVVRDGHYDIEKLDEREARRLYDVLRKRFEGADGR